MMAKTIKANHISVLLDLAVCIIFEMMAKTIKANHISVLLLAL